MKMKEINALSLDEKYHKAQDLKETLLNLRFQHEIGDLDNPQKMKQIKRDIARLKTALRAEAAARPAQ